MFCILEFEWKYARILLWFTSTVYILVYDRLTSFAVKEKPRTSFALSRKVGFSSAVGEFN